MTNKLHKFVPPFTLYLNVENAQNPVQKEFEKTNIYFELTYESACSQPGVLNKIVCHTIR